MKTPCTNWLQPCRWLLLLGTIHVLQQLQWLVGLAQFIS